MMRALGVLCALLLAVPTAAQQPGTGRPADRRMQLEQRVLMRFVERAGDELQLDEARRERLRTVVRTNALERRQLHRAAALLRQQLASSLAQDAPDSAFARILAEQRSLRSRELALAGREQDQLASFLTPRQQAQYLLLWLQLQDNARMLVQQRGRRGPVP
ncbi:MAG TPA: hypothetical protein VK939_10710 [Longimicrobiales bacterium]|nr:hypothetical protein [Longimicrobiales bacterium]